MNTRHHCAPVRPRRLSLALALLPFAPLATAQDVTLTPIVVEARRDDPSLIGSSAVGTGTVQSLRSATSDTATLLREVPGMSIYGAGGVSSLPVIRGLADNRLRIKVDGMDLIASCPNHMNPPLSYLDPTNVGALQVYAGITPVSVGGDSIGGTIIASTPAPDFAAPGEAPLAQGEAGTFFRSNNNARGVNLSATYATESFNLSYSGALSKANNYTAGGDFKTFRETGRAGHTLSLDEVGSTAYDTRNHNLGLAFRGSDQLFEARVGYQDMPYQLWPNQRMDLLDNEQLSVNLRYLGQFEWGTLEAGAYRETVDHFMDFGDDKRFFYGSASGGAAAINPVPCSPISPACAQGMPMYTESRTIGGTIKADIDLAQGDVLRVGTEFQRYRLDDWWPASGGGMWPDTFVNINDGERNRNAVFAEWESQAHARWNTLVGARFERVRTDAGPVSPYSAMAGGQSQADAFNARDRERTDNNWDFTALARYTLDATRDIEFGIARKVRSPSLYERYTWRTRGMEMLMVNWFGDGNGYVGDIDLEPEKAYTVSATFDWHAPDRSWEFKATPYYTRVSDYIDAVRCPTSLGGACTEANLSATDSFVFLQLANQSARLYGVDLSGQAPLGRTAWGEWGVKGLLNYTNGKNRDTGDRLYNIMPLNAKLTLTHRIGGWDNGIEVEGVTAKTRVSEVRNEVETSGFGLVNARASYSWKQARVDFGVENLFDRFYRLPLGGAYLGQGTTMTSTPVGIVPRWGNVVPGMGRSIYAGLNVTF
ncbi:TonB-dependent receptor [Rhodocyclaceae bacterium SMB388]